MSNKYERRVVECNYGSFDIERPLSDIIPELQEIVKKHPNAEFTWEWCYEHKSLVIIYFEPESDEQYQKRLAQERINEELDLVRKRRQYEQLKKELGLDDEQ